MNKVRVHSVMETILIKMAQGSKRKCACQNTVSMFPNFEIHCLCKCKEFKKWVHKEENCGREINKSEDISPHQKFDF